MTINYPLFLSFIILYMIKKLKLMHPRRGLFCYFEWYKILDITWNKDLNIFKVLDYFKKRWEDKKITWNIDWWVKQIWKKRVAVIWWEETIYIDDYIYFWKYKYMSLKYKDEFNEENWWYTDDEIDEIKKDLWLWFKR